MKTTKTTLSVAMAIMVATFVFCGCQKDGGGKLESGWFDGRITATVDNSVPTTVARVVAWNDTGFSGGYLTGKNMCDPVTYSGSSFTVNLPNPPPSAARMETIKYLFENALGVSGATYSDPGVRITDADFLAFNSALNQVYGFFSNRTSDGNMECMYIYAQSDATVTGGSNLSVSFKEGWNRLYVSSKLITTKTQSGLKWYFGEFNF
jgi:hypothetical protein